MIKVIDNFVNSAYYEGIEENVLANPSFPWGFFCKNRIDNIVDAGTDTTSRLFGFSHTIFDAGKTTSPFYEFLLPLILQAKAEIGARVLLRARADMTVILGDQLTYKPHIDMPGHKEHVNMLLYVGDSDGDTIIYKDKYFPSASLASLQLPFVEPKLLETLTEEQRITPKANRLVIFSGEHWHTRQSPKEYNRRVLLNLNFAKDDYRTKD